MSISGSKFVITGGASLVGSHIAEQLLAAGAAKVVLFDNYSLGSPQTIDYLLEDKRVSLVRGDITRINELMDAFDGIDGVFSVAAFLTLPLSLNPPMGIDVNINGQYNVLSAAAWRKVKKVVFSSSIGVYGNLSPGDVTEDRPFVADGLQPAAALYGSSKVMGEQMCRLFSERYGVATASLRYGNVYGERQHHRGVNSNPMIEAYESIRAGKRPVIEGDGLSTNYYVYVGDAARGNVLAMEKDVSGEAFNILDPKPASLLHIIETVLKVSGSDLKIEHVPPKPKPAFALQPGLKFSIAKAEKLLGWKPQYTIEQGLERLIRWREKQPN